MAKKKASKILEVQLQELLWEYILCLKHYCGRFYEYNVKDNASLTAEELDQFISVLKSLRALLEAVQKNTMTTPLPHHHLEKKNTRKKTQ